ncbi:MAG: sulfite exporter TauE/SafE family protein [Gammaproteobacteria bacterium]|nr:sulfite exporter TauE/SafE family protein [Gammaproteobacteria bacterium]
MLLSHKRVVLSLLLLPVIYWGLFHTHEYAPFSLLGMLGAIFANATGAGGGVVFIPAFQQLGISDAQSVATSFAIQCFGMTVGAIVWSKHARRCDFPDWRLMPRLLVVSVPFSILGIWSVYGFSAPTPTSVSSLFAYFSIFIGLGLLLTNVFKKPLSDDVQHELVKQHIDRLDIIALIVISFIGGAVTAWLSVGVGEFVAFYLILRGYRVTMAIATAVIISAISVWSGIGYHLAAGEVYYDILLFAGPAAAIGAVIARILATRLPVVQLKMFFAGWVLFAGVFELVTS